MHAWVVSCHRFTEISNIFREYIEEHIPDVCPRWTPRVQGPPSPSQKQSQSCPERHVGGSSLPANDALRRRAPTVRTDYAQGTRDRNWSIEITHLPVFRLEKWCNTYTTVFFAVGSGNRVNTPGCSSYMVC